VRSSLISGSIGLQRQEIVGCSLDRLLLPLRLGRKPQGGSTHFVERELGADPVIDPRGTIERLPGPLRQIGNVEPGSKEHRATDAISQRCRHACFL